MRMMPGLAASHLSKSHKEELIIGQVDGRKSLLLSTLLDKRPIGLKTNTHYTR